MSAVEVSPLYDGAVPEADEVIEAFQRLWYDSRHLTWASLRWRGVRIRKYPTDLFIYQELVTELAPDWIVECGTFEGGSALYLADLCELSGHGQVITIDVQPVPGAALGRVVMRGGPSRGRITYITGRSTDASIVQQVKDQVGRGVMLLILDSDHSAANVWAELEAYAGLAAYIIVEDTNLNGHPVKDEFGPGPAEGVASFLAGHREWELDIRRERLLLTANPGGFLRRRP